MAFLCAALPLFAAGCGTGSRDGGPEGLLEGFREQKKVLLSVQYTLPRELSAKGVSFEAGTLSTHELFLRNRRDRGRFLHLDREGKLHGTEAGGVEGVASGEILIMRGGRVLFLDNRPLPIPEEDWELFWVSTERRLPAATLKLYRAVRFSDSFMVADLSETGWRAKGDCFLRRQGGGIPATLEEERNFGFARAANPFTIQACGGGRLVLEGRDQNAAGLVDFHAELRFYFGEPRTGPVVNRDSVPEEASLLVAQGVEGGFQAGFGWMGPQTGFAISTRERAGPWKIVAQWKESRPPLTNWGRLGLRISHGYIAEGWLDGVRILSTELPKKAEGPLYIESGKALVEFDDVKVFSLPEPEPLGDPYFVKSRSFANKNKVDEAHDPPQYWWWARSDDAFVRRRVDEGGKRLAEMVTSSPLMGDFDYESLPSEEEAGELPDGLYRFALWKHDPLKAPGSGPPDFSVSFARAGEAWTPAESGTEMAAAGNLFTLRLLRRDRDGGRLALDAGGNCLIPLSPPIPGPVHFGVARISADEPREGDYPAPALHRIFCRRLVNEFFEEAPSAWSWVDGAFRMDARWACANQWNFMAGSSPAVPYMTSKRSFGGDQEHKYFMSLRPSFPYDGGDPDFSYDPEADMKTGFTIFKKNHGWYNRRDLNFSFCSNGRDPLSGYAVVFAGDDNRETRLLRRGRVVAANAEKRALIPKDVDHGVIHWRWWAFHVRRYGPSITVDLNGERLLAFDDPEPLPGGHIGFWSVRSGFTVSRVVSVSERGGEEPQILYARKSCDSPWRPLSRDSVHLSAGGIGGMTRVTANVGAGFFAVRHPLPAPVELAETPVLEIPLIIGTDAMVNLHLEIGDASYVAPVSAPLGRMNSFLTPQYEKGEMFQLPEIPEGDLALRTLEGAVLEGGVLRMNLQKALEGKAAGRLLLKTITIGNTSNRDYLLAGGGGNRAGAYFEVGEPRFTKP